MITKKNSVICVLLSYSILVGHPSHEQLRTISCGAAAVATILCACKALNALYIYNCLFTDCDNKIYDRYLISEQEMKKRQVPFLSCRTCEHCTARGGKNDHIIQVTFPHPDAYARPEGFDHSFTVACCQKDRATFDALIHFRNAPYKEQAYRWGLCTSTLAFVTLTLYYATKR